MPPIRRYLRITQYSVLECRIYLDNPADAQRWLLNERSPALPRVIEAIRPLVLPKLREENARAKAGKGGKRKGWKDTVVKGARSQLIESACSSHAYFEADDLEVAIFLTEISSRHSILRKEKHAEIKTSRLGTIEGKMTGSGTRDVPVEIRDEASAATIREESQEEKVLNIEDIPMAGQSPSRFGPEERGESLLVSDDSETEELSSEKKPASKRKKTIKTDNADGEEDDKKKIAFNTAYDGFSIYGRILCLVVKRRGKVRGKESSSGAGQAMMEEWISSTQMGEAQMMDE